MIAVRLDLDGAGARAYLGVKSGVASIMPSDELRNWLNCEGRHYHIRMIKPYPSAATQFEFTFECPADALYFKLAWGVSSETHVG